MANKTFCSNCSEEITGKKFCPSCGTKTKTPEKDEKKSKKKEVDYEEYPTIKLLDSITESKIQKSGKTKYEIAAEIKNKKQQKSMANARKQGVRLHPVLFTSEIVKSLEEKERKKLNQELGNEEGGDVLVNAWDDSPGLTDSERRLQAHGRAVLRQRAEDKARDAGKKEFEFPEGSGKMHEVTIKKARSGGCLGVLLIGFILAISLVSI